MMVSLPATAGISLFKDVVTLRFFRVAALSVCNPIKYA